MPRRRSILSQPAADTVAVAKRDPSFMHCTPFQILQNYPDNTLTPNAWYWLAQVQYKQKKLDEARVSFLNVARFTSSTKRPDALYKLGLISKMRGDKDKAQAYFNLVIRTYPADTSSNLARKELASL